MSYLTLSAGWNSNHLSASFFDSVQNDTDSKNLFFDENGNPLVTFVERKGAVRLHSMTEQSQGGVNTTGNTPQVVDMMDVTGNNEISGVGSNEKMEIDEERLCGEVYGWDGEVEIHHQNSVNGGKSYGWAKKWNSKWNNANRDYLTVLPELHKADPPEMTSYMEGYSRMGEYRYLDVVEENLRRMAESCNRIEGMVHFGDCFDGFSGVTTRLLELVNDEYSRKSLLFNVNEPWGRITPFSMMSSAMSLLAPATLNIPVQSCQSEETDLQSESLRPIMKLFLQSLTKTSIPNLAQFILPRPQNILSIYSTVPSGNIYDYFHKNRPETSEECLSWLPAHSFKKHRTFSTFTILSGPEFEFQKSRDPKTVSTHPFMKRADVQEANALWNYNDLQCVTESIVMPYENEYRMVALRNSNQIHFHIATQLEKLKRFSSKLTRMEEDDWIEKIEALETIRDETRSTPFNDDTSSSSDSD